MNKLSKEMFAFMAFVLLVGLTGNFIGQVIVFGLKNSGIEALSKLF